MSIGGSITETENQLGTWYASQLTTMKNELSAAGGANGSQVNILTSYDWAVNFRKPADVTRIPHVKAIEFRLSQHALASFMKHMATAYLSNASSTTANVFAPYAGLYAGKEVAGCFNYVFPHSSNNYFEFSNSWGASPQDESAISSAINETGILGSGLISSLHDLQGILSAFSSEGTGLDVGSKGVYIDRPQYFQYSNDTEQVDVSFVLYNNLSRNSSAKTVPWKKNYYFIRNFAFKNLPFKLSAFKYYTPALYDVHVPGAKRLPVAYVSSFRVTSVGQQLLANLDNQQITVPEAWKVNITFKSLIAKSANLLWAACGSQDSIKSDVITNDRSISSTIPLNGKKLG